MVAREVLQSALGRSLEAVIDHHPQWLETMLEQLIERQFIYLLFIYTVYVAPFFGGTRISLVRENKFIVCTCLVNLPRK